MREMSGRLMRKIGKDKAGFIKSSITLMSGSIIAQILSVCFSPIMTRLYSEAEIGQYTLVLTAVSMFGAVICLRYDMAIVPEEDESKVFAIIKLSFLLDIILSVLVGFGYSVYCSIKGTIQSLSFAGIVFWTTILLLFTGLGHILLAYNNRNKEYKLMTSVHVIREVGRDVSLSGLGLLHFGTIGLLISQTLSVGLGLTRQSKSLRSKKVHWREIGNQELKEVAIKHKKQPMFSVPASFFNSFSYSVLNIYVSNLYGLQQLAYYSMSFRMLGLPLALISTNMSKVYFERASREYEQTGEFRKTFLMTTGLLGAIAIPMVVILFFLAPFLFGVFFGAPWRASGEYVRILAPMFGIRLVVSALSPTMTIIQKQNWDLYIQILFLLASSATYFLCGGGKGIETFLVLVSVMYSVVYIVYYIYMFLHTRKKV